MGDCIFCKIIEGEIPSKKVFENDKIMAFLDIFPISKGHTLVVPKEHFETLGDMDPSLLEDFFKVVQDLSVKLKEKLGADGYNIISNNYKAAGQDIPHLHFHIIPRWEGDNAIKFQSPGIQAKPEELDAILDQLK